MRRMAGECGYRSMLVAIGVAQGGTQNCEVISYEAPFGVGYLVAQLVGSADTPSAPADLVAQPDIPALARRAVEAFAMTGKIIEHPTDVSDLLSVAPVASFRSRLARESCAVASGRSIR
jgi:hypothetical protein